MRKIYIPLAIATFLVLTGFGIFRATRGKITSGQSDDGITIEETKDLSTIGIEDV